jgi:hypothetical protein
MAKSDDNEMIMFTDSWTPVRAEAVPPPIESIEETPGDSSNEDHYAESLDSVTWEELEGFDHSNLSGSEGPASQHGDECEFAILNDEDYTTYFPAIE